MNDTHRDVFVHHKGGRYRLLYACALHADDLAPMHVYMSMDTGQVFVRPASEWGNPVQWPDGKIRARFCRSWVCDG